MSQSLSDVLLHIIYSTKERQPFLQDAQVRRELHRYVGGILKKRKCPLVEINSVVDHLHLLCRFDRNITIADLLRDLKASSSGFIKNKYQDLRGFQWQSGYGVFSVSQSQVPRVRKYIVDQEKHHLRQSYQEELRKLLIKHEIEFDERYVWD